ncbi:MAG: hypothetical protein U1F65_00045 [Verrucomicrobiota bacterium]
MNSLDKNSRPRKFPLLVGASADLMEKSQPDFSATRRKILRKLMRALQQPASNQ